MDAYHTQILRREFERVARLTDAAYEEMMAEEDSSRAASAYKDWTALLLRYHDAIERVSGKESGTVPASMKGEPDASPPQTPSGMSTADDPRTHSGTVTSAEEAEAQGHRGYDAPDG